VLFALENDRAFIGTTKYPEDITPVDQSLKPVSEFFAEFKHAHAHKQQTLMLDVLVVSRASLRIQRIRSSRLCEGTRPLRMSRDTSRSLRRRSKSAKPRCSWASSISPLPCH
jgi:hypothetical protein